MTDPFDPVSVHGVWPLVLDPESPGGIRFADLEADAPADCVRDPADLPALWLGLRAFASPEARDAWCEAAAEFGGNAVHATPLAEDAIPAALLIRYDREPLSGATLEERVAFAGSRPARATSVRSDLRMRRAHDRRRSTLGKAWATELAAAAAVEGVRFVEHLSPLEEKRIVLYPERDRFAAAIFVEPHPAGRRVTLRTSPNQAFDLREPDLARAMREAAAALGWRIGEDGDAVRELPACDEAGLARVMADVAQMARTRKGLLETTIRRGVVSSALDERPRQILRRLVDGFPLAKAPASSTYAYQVNPVSGHAIDVDNYALERLWEAGTIQPFWWSGHAPPARDADRLGSKPFDAFEASLWVATPLGRDLVEGRVTLAEAAERVEASRAAASIVMRGAPPNGLDGLAGLAPLQAWTPPPNAPAPPPARGRGPRRLPKRAKDLAQLGAWIAHGVIDPAPADEDVPSLPGPR